MKRVMKNMIDIDQFVKYILRPELIRMQKSSVAAEVLLLGTALVESRLTYIKQLGHGPALGFYQMEPATHEDIWRNYLRYRPSLRASIAMKKPSPDRLIYDMKYATAMARVHYLRVPKKLPAASNAEEMAQYHKVYYNTHLGKTKPEESVELFKKAYKEILK